MDAMIIESLIGMAFVLAFGTWLLIYLDNL
jgi:hypothetical protein